MTAITRRTTLASIGAVLGSFQLPTLAQTYPIRPITIVVPFPAGGGTDIIARVIAEKMAERLGQPVVVDNKPGASGNIGTDFVAKAKPDGYTLVLSLTTSLLSNQFLYKKLPFNPREDLTLISQIAEGPLVIVVNPSKISAKTGPELLKFIANNKNKISYGSWGAGSGAHLFGAYMSQSQNGGMSHVPYKGEGPMVQDLVGGQIDMAICGALTAKGFVDQGKLCAIAVTGSSRVNVLPNVPTMLEQGISDPMFRIVGFAGVAGPAGMPAALVKKLSDEINAITQLTDVRARLSMLGMTITARGPTEFRAVYERDMPIWQNLIKASGAQLD